MIDVVAIENYRSVLNLKLELENLNVITGANGSGKSNLYKALRLLYETAQGGVVNSLALEGGLQSAFWAGPQDISRRMKSGDVPIQGTVSTKRKLLRLGFMTEDLSYSIDLGLPQPSTSAFSLDAEIKEETIWAGGTYHPAAVLVSRKGPVVKVRSGRGWDIIYKDAHYFESMLSQITDIKAAPEIIYIRDLIKSWRFYDYFPTDPQALTRSPQLGTYTPVLHHDGRDLAAALQTIIEIGDPELLFECIQDAFPESKISVAVQSDNRFILEFHQKGLLRPLKASELSDGTLRYLLLVAALLTPRPPKLMVLNEPETSLHPSLLPALARLIVKASKLTQIWTISHSQPLISAIKKNGDCNLIKIEKNLGETIIPEQTLTNQVDWKWPARA